MFFFLFLSNKIFVQQIIETKKAAKNGYVVAQHNLGVSFFFIFAFVVFILFQVTLAEDEDTMALVDHPLEKAFKWYKRAVEQGLKFSFFVINERTNIFALRF